MNQPMNQPTCEEVRISLGVYVLGALDEAERAAVEAHLDGCPECAAELAELSGLPAMLSRVDPGDIALAATPPRAVLDRLLAASAKRHRRSRVLFSLAASIVVVAVGGAVLTATLRPTPESTVAGAAAPAMSSAEQGSAGQLAAKDAEGAADKVVPESAPAGTSDARTNGDTQGGTYKGTDGGDGSSAISLPPEIMAQPATEPIWYAADSGKVKLALGLLPEEGGTRVDIALSGVPNGTACRLVAVDVKGTVSPVSSWTVRKEDYRNGRAHLPPGSSEYTIEQLDRFELITPSGTRLATVLIRPDTLLRTPPPP